MKSDQIDQIATAIAKAQLALEPAVFDGYNPHFKSKFATLASVIDAAKIFAEHGIGFTQTTGFISTGDQVRFCVELTLMHSSGQWIKGFYPIPEGLTSQQLGSAITYAKRYQLAAALGITADEDDDGADGNGKLAQPRITSQQVATLEAALKVKNISVESTCAWYGIDRLSFLPADKYEGALKRIQDKQVAAKGATQ